MYIGVIPLGRLVMTRAVSDIVADDEVLAKNIMVWLASHRRGECRHLDEHDRGANRQAIAIGERVFTSWPTGRDDEPKLWIITEADRSSTTLLWPSDY
jgi:hypothetical protein